MRKRFLTYGAAMAGLAVIIGAFGSHGLKDTLLESGTTETFKTGVLYHMFHCVALLIVGLLSQKDQKNSLLQWAGYCFLVGILFFSGSLYLLSVFQLNFLGPVTPIGGLFFIAGWTLTIIYAYSYSEDN